MTNFSDAVIGITGAGGNLGRHVVKHLREAGAKHVVALTRQPEKVEEFAKIGVEVRAVSFDEPASLPKAFAGIERLLIISLDTLHKRAERQIAAVDAAVKAGVRHIAYTSITSPYPDPNPNALVPNTHYWTEIAIAASGVDFVLLRNNLYTDFLLPAAHHAIAGGTLYHAAGSGRRAFITRADCAVAAGEAMLKADGKRIYDIGGPEALSGDDLAAILAGISGKPVKAVSVPVDGFAANLAKAGVPHEMAGVLANFDSDAGKGLLGIVSGAVEELIGRKPQSVDDFLKAHRSAIVG